MKAVFRSSFLCAAGLALSVAATGLVAADAPPAGVRALFLRQLSEVEQHVNSLAEAIPADKYSWRPGDGVRSVSEVLLHIAGANYFFPTMSGTKPPAGFDPKMEKTVKDKAKIEEIVKQSFEHVRHAVEGLSDADMARQIKLFGRPSTVEGLYFLMANHMHEHMGQLIAYARVNGVVPPWSMKP